ncbi:MAG: lipoyl(octanoyl) transferase LipB [Deltaproteobacteria bacterium]|nr:lipoyl(octanoyl) transferase LipB [Deltaproteobacteria bacterium]
MPPPLEWAWLGRVPYREALEAQRARREAVIARTTPPVLWLLEHDPVVTEGRRPASGGLSPEALARLGIDHVSTERGGLATYHGPGQLVGYLICPIDDFGLTVKGTVSALEDALIAYLAQQRLQAGRRPGYPGVWIGREKIAALGLNFRMGVSMHGFALNCTVDLAPFGYIVPCGITDGGVTSLERLLGASAPTPRDAAPAVAASVIRVLLRVPCPDPPLARPLSVP